MELKARTLKTTAQMGDYVVRTSLASAVTAIMAPGALALDQRPERRRLEYYAALAAAHDPAKVFSPPPSPIPVHARPGIGLEDVDGKVELLRFHSPFEPLHPDMRPHFRPRSNNATARAQYWRHSEPRPTLLVIHGFGASSASLNTTFFSLKRFFTDGWDIVLFTLPFHGSRRGDFSPFNGSELFSAGFSRLNEGMLQAICDLQVIVDYLFRKGAPRIGVTGLSLGGYTSALLASVDDRLDFAIPNAAVSDIGTLIKDWFPANYATVALERIKHIPTELMDRACALHSPLNYPVKLSKDRLLIIGGLGDRMAPPSQSEALWEHWDHPELHWFPGSHLLHFGRGDYFKLMQATMGPVALDPAVAPGPLDPPEPPVGSDPAPPVPLRPRLQSM